MTQFKSLKNLEKTSFKILLLDPNLRQIWLLFSLIAQINKRNLYKKLDNVELPFLMKLRKNCMIFSSRVKSNQTFLRVRI